MAEKFTLSGIYIEYDGRQITNKIMERYGSIEAFMEKSGIILTPKTVSKHLRSKRLKAESAKSAFVLALNTGWDELVRPVRLQLEDYARQINRNIPAYSSRKDIPIATKLIDICKSEIDYHQDYKSPNEDKVKEHIAEAERLKLTLSKLYRAKGMMYFYCGDTTTAEELVRLAIDEIRGKTTDLIVYYYSDLGLIACYNSQKDNAINQFRAAEFHLGNLKGKVDEYILFYFNYCYATALYNIQYYKQAEMHLMECMKYTEDADNIGSIYLKLGLIRKVQGEVEDAFKYYNKAIELYEDDRYAAVVFNNIANLHKELGKFDEALEYINKAIAMCRGKDIGTEILCNFTLYEINIANKTNTELKVLFDSLRKIGHIYIYKVDLIARFNILTKLLKKDKEKLTELRDYIYNMTKAVKANNNTVDFLKELSYCYIKISQYLDKK